MTASVPALFTHLRERVQRVDVLPVFGEVSSFVGTIVEASGVTGPIGAVASIEAEGAQPMAAEVVGFRDDRVLLMALDDVGDIARGSRVRIESKQATTPAGDACLGRVIDGLGRPIDGGPALTGAERAPLQGPPVRALDRRRIDQPLDLGVRPLNAMTTVGRGMRLGIFAGSGVGKSTLLGQVARFTEAEVAVIALVGERGREVRDFLERDLGDGLQRSVVVVATGDESPLMRVRAAHAAAAIAEQFQRQGRDVLLLMDSLTRYCSALREIGIAAGEPATSRGYPPSVWSALPKLVERAGNHVGGGSVTGVYTVLVEGDDPEEPVSDAARSVLDGHVFLSREIAERGQFPAIDVLASVSRVMESVVEPAHLAMAARVRELLASYRRAEDLISIGAYATGSDPQVDEARSRVGPLREMLSQSREEKASLRQSVEAMARALGGVPA